MSVTENDSRFKEIMGGFFHDLLRASGITMTPGNANERLREIGERMASAIEHAAERKAIQVIKKLQAAVSDAFTKTEEEQGKIKTLVLVHQSMLDSALDNQQRLRDTVNDLQNRVNALHTGRSTEK